MKNIFFKLLLIFTAIAMILSMGSPVIVYADPPAYNIVITNNTFGALSITLSGTASAINVPGQINDQHVTIIWGDGQISENISHKRFPWIFL